MVQLLSTLSWFALYQNYLCGTTFDIGASFLMSVSISKSQFEICRLTPFKLLPICKGINWLVEHLDCSNIVDRRGQKQGTKGSKESSLGHLKYYLTAKHWPCCIPWHQLQTQLSNAKDDRSHKEITDSILFGFLFIFHKLVRHCAWILVGI